VRTRLGCANQRIGNPGEALLDLFPLVLYIICLRSIPILRRLRFSQP
jgi:hypothetical protein